MKKLTLVLLSILLAGCSSSNDSSEPSSDLIVGVWKPIKEVEVCQDNSLEEYFHDSCAQNNERVIFNSNGIFNNFFFQDFNGNCTQTDSSSGTWEIENGKLYVTTYGNKKQVTFFELTKNTLRLGSVEEDPFDDPCSATVGLSHYYTEYVRVE